MTEYADAALDLARAARTAGMGENGLNEWLKPRVGLTFCKLLTRYRVYRSFRVLLEKDETLTQAAIDNGFDGPAQNISSRYSRTVKNILGLPAGRILPRGPDRKRGLDLEALRRAGADVPAPSGLKKSMAAGAAGGGTGDRRSRAGPVGRP